MRAANTVAPPLGQRSQLHLQLGIIGLPGRTKAVQGPATGGARPGRHKRLGPLHALHPEEYSNLS